MPERVPPGRAGRLWLMDRLETARRGMQLLDKKQQLLQREYRRLALLARDRRRGLESACTQAAQWAKRATMLGNRSEIAVIAGSIAGRAGAKISWRNTMGVVHPEEASCVLPEVPATELAASNGAMAPCAAAHRRALELAVGVAVAENALARVGEELQATQRRHRAVERRRVPALTEALQRLELQLEELEREDRLVSRWVRNRRSS
jgi:V/A-type H+/Na+-transporting ATPase subunit D